VTETTTNNDACHNFALQVVRTLCEAGYEALWAGGCVRDRLLGVTPKDYDVATSALPEQVREVFGKRRTLPIGAAFGVITVLGPKNAGQIEVATFRTEADYSDGRRPDQVKYTTAEFDASRRDFTINGLFFDPLEDELIDYVGGQADLDAKVLRAIGDAEKRFDEDKLRMLRAVRFAATLDFEIELATAKAIAKHAEKIDAVSAERIGAELRRMLTHPSCPRAIECLQSLGLLRLILPELSDVRDTQLAEFKMSYSQTSTPSVALALTLLLEPHASAAQIRSAAGRLKFTRKEAERAGWLAEYSSGLNKAETRAWSEVQPLLAHPAGSDLVSLYEARHGNDQTGDFCRAKLQLPLTELVPPPLVTGDDLVRQGFNPGPTFAKMLQRIRAAQLDGQIHTLDEALALINNNQGKG